MAFIGDVAAIWDILATDSAVPILMSARKTAQMTATLMLNVLIMMAPILVNASTDITGMDGAVLT